MVAISPPVFPETFRMESITSPEMNSSSGSYLPSILVPAQCNDASGSVPALLKCLASRGLSGVGLIGLSKHKLALKRVAEYRAIPVHLRNDIGITQGQYMAAQLTSLMRDQQ